MRRAPRNVVLWAGASAFAAGVALVIASADGDGEGVVWPIAMVMLVAGSVGLYLVPVVLQVREAMASMRAMHGSAVPVLRVTAVFVIAASGVLVVAGLVSELVWDPGTPSGAADFEFDRDGLADVGVLLLWWWPLALSAAIVVAVTELARRGVRRWVASRRSRAAGGNGSA